MLVRALIGAFVDSSREPRPDHRYPQAHDIDFPDRRLTVPPMDTSQLLLTWGH